MTSAFPSRDVDLRFFLLSSRHPQTYGIAADTWFEYPLSLPLESTAVVT
jgi:hypothetical protein